MHDLPWADRPPPVKSLPHLPMKRLGPGEKLTGALTIHAMIGIYTHFWQRRTLPCGGEQCPACADNRPRRWEGYISLWTPTPSKHVIIALTPGAAADLSNELGPIGNDRGRIIVVERLGKRPNGRVVARAAEESRPESGLPPMPDLRAHLIHIWGLDAANVGQDQPDYRKAIIKAYDRGDQHQPSSESA